ncbi:hypothetical protein FGSG_13200 [Fusarium graminearum PH-1]|uniref:Chromosome 4, complete genome n=1 Tax=Gibberella zeae (strain ATCC MYA-4620 / CBS 123657 / FGSC 9075 / NRRL 31084 / PH-1) TaxID=229533 RepID=I1S8M2_GIBZE|nr:hypothetical protein FGSG_13200 [Fusarium graminearum PH-1]ESU14022.1 hypothetical protein FGSG_13200 [Fusarium graminearum PH-1]CEF84543.1 unnamed protein product [Fusarium graminearum]|eukprot:XP_011327529.1 hypothetical protein FGSG_13200 [Fusarium graminearum PH-1]
MAPAAKDSPTTEDSVQHWKSYVETHTNTTEYVLERNERVLITKPGFDPSTIYIIVEACQNEEYRVKRDSDNEIVAERYELNNKYFRYPINRDYEIN